MSQAPQSAGDVRPTPMHELESMLAALPKQTHTPTTAQTQKPKQSSGAVNTSLLSLGNVNATTPKVDLLLRPQATPQPSSADVLLPSSSVASPASISAVPSASACSASSVSSRVCASCTRQYAKYVCPKCNLSTCSLACYKAHNANCTHVFASGALEEERILDSALRAGIGRTRAVLGAEYAQAREARKQTKDIMQRVATFNEKDQRRMEDVLRGADEEDDAHESDEDDEAESQQEHQTQQRLVAALSLLEKLESSPSSGSSAVSNSDLLELQSLLPPELLKDFQRSIVDGRMAQWIQRWKPWWRPADLHSEDTEAKGADVTKKAAELNPMEWSIPAIQMEDDESELPADTPPMPANIPPFATLFPSGSPSPLLPVHLAELLYAYVYALTLYNGDPDSELPQLLEVMATLSPVLAGRPTESETTGGAPRVAAASSTPSFAPTPSLLPALESTVSRLLSSVSTSATLGSASSSCCAALGRVGDVCQLQQGGRRYVLRALAHMQSMVDRAKAKAKKRHNSGTKPASAAAAASAASSSSGPRSPASSTSSSSSSSLSHSSLSRKLLFFQSFVSFVLTDSDLRSWNRALHAIWKERWTMHQAMHKGSAGKPTDAAAGSSQSPPSNRSAASIEIIED